ncbi:MAG: thymidylate kinase [Bacteroidales bacterium]|nr:thymidylate kinase [Bacteroidales bacterium]
MLIVMEGLDGAGKSTQVKKLKEYLLQRCGELEYIHFPRYDAPVYGDLISRFLRGDFGDNDQVHPQLVALLFAEDRHGAAPAIREALRSGKTVLLDRYVYSNIAYQCAKLKDLQERDRLRDWIFRTEYGDFDLPVPDLNLFLDVPIGFVQKSLSQARIGQDRNYLEGAQDIHEASIAFQQEVRSIYVAQTRLDRHFLRIDCADPAGEMLPPDAIFSKVRETIDPFLP